MSTGIADGILLGLIVGFGCAVIAAGVFCAIRSDVILERTPALKSIAMVHAIAVAVFGVGLLILHAGSTLLAAILRPVLLHH